MDKVDNTAKRRVQQERLSHMCEIVILKLPKQESNEILGVREYSTFLGPLVSTCLYAIRSLFSLMPARATGFVSVVSNPEQWGW